MDVVLLWASGILEECHLTTVQTAISIDQAGETMQIITPEKKLGFDPDKSSELLEELIEVFQSHKPTVGEIVTVLSNLTYALGASIGDHGSVGPGVEELKRLYYSEPGRMDVALMLQGLTMATWFLDWEKLRIQDTSKSGEDNETQPIRPV